MVRLPVAVRDEAEPSDRSNAEETDERSSAFAKIRPALAALAVAAIGYLVIRRARSDETAQEGDEEGEPAEDFATDEAREIPIDETDEAEEDAETTDEVEPGEGTMEAGARETVEGAGESAEADVPGVDRSDEEIAERAESDVQEEPAEPGEMTVDEDVVEDVVDEDEEGETEAEDVGDEEGEREEEDTEAEADEADADAEGETEEDE